MLPIVIKDLHENRRHWIVFVILAAASILLSRAVAVTPVRQSMLEGFIYSVVLASALIFTQNVVIAERKRRHFLFLKSLPVDDSEIVKAKFLSVALLTGTLGNVPLLLALLTGSMPSFGQWLLANSILLFYAALLLYFAIRFQSPAVLFLPLYLFIGLALLSEGSPLNAVVFLEVLISSPLLIFSLALAAAFLFLYLSIKAFQAKELDF